jgi:hypothetical protein
MPTPDDNEVMLRALSQQVMAPPGSLGRDVQLGSGGLTQSQIAELMKQVAPLGGGQVEPNSAYATMSSNPYNQSYTPEQQRMMQQMGLAPPIYSRGFAGPGAP